MPDNEETVQLFHLLSQANVDLRQPVSLEEQLMEDSDIDADVGAAMVQLLKVSCTEEVGSIDQSLQTLLLLMISSRSSSSWRRVSCCSMLLLPLQWFSCSR